MIYRHWPSVGTIATTAGDDITWYFQVRDASGAAVDITGWEFSFYAVDQRDATNTLTVANGSFTIATAASGLGYFTIARDSTTSQGGKVFKCELWKTNTGAQKMIAAGDWKVMATIRS